GAFGQVAGHAGADLIDARGLALAIHGNLREVERLLGFRDLRGGLRLLNLDHFDPRLSAHGREGPAADQAESDPERSEHQQLGRLLLRWRRGAAAGCLRGQARQLARPDAGWKRRWRGRMGAGRDWLFTGVLHEPTS